MAWMAVLMLMLMLIAMTTVASFSPSRRGGRPRSSQGRGRGGVVRKVITSRDETTTRLSYKSSDRVNASNSALPAASRMASRESSVRPIRTIEEYEAFVLGEKDRLVIVRFHAPWCKICRATDVAYERFATKIRRAYPQKINFLSVNMDGREDSNELKDLLSRDHGLDVRSVPMGMLYHPRERGIIAKVRLNMNRKHLIVMKQNIELYLREGADVVSLLDDLEML